MVQTVQVKIRIFLIKQVKSHTISTGSSNYYNILILKSIRLSYLVLKIYIKKNLIGTK